MREEEEGAGGKSGVKATWLHSQSALRVLVQHANAFSLTKVVCQNQNLVRTLRPRDRRMTPKSSAQNLPTDQPCCIISTDGAPRLRQSHSSLLRTAFVLVEQTIQAAVLGREFLVFDWISGVHGRRSFVATMEALFVGELRQRCFSWPAL